MGEIQRQHNPRRDQERWAGLQRVSLGEEARVDIRKQVADLAAEVKLGDFVLSRQVAMAVGPEVGGWENSVCQDIQTTMRDILWEKGSFRLLCPGFDVVVGTLEAGELNKSMRPALAAIGGEETDPTYLDVAFSHLIDQTNTLLIDKPRLRIN